MDLPSSVRDKLAYFRIKELKDVLTQLGLPKQGKKQELVDKILSLLSDEQGPRLHAWAKRQSMGKDGVAKIIDDTYRKMQIPGATDLASKSQSSSDINQVKPKEEAKDLYQDMKVRCPCGSSLVTDSMIQCEDSRCHVWQHIDCVLIPEKPVEGVCPEVPPCFYCEVCRLNRADPFWVTVAHPLLATKLVSSGIESDGSNAVQCMEKTYPLSIADKELLQRTEYDLQVWCILLNDKVSFRMQWPQHVDLHVNGVPVRTINRQGSQLLGINGRDDGPLITICSREGINKISLSRGDTRTFCFGIRIAKRRTVQQVLNIVPKEADGERFEDALARVCRCICGGNATDNADSDSDLEVVADSVTVNLRCPMSGSRIKIAGRFKPCVHMGCFDLETFVELNQRSRKWQCPICLKNYSLENIIIDPYFNRITSLIRNCGDDVIEIDVKPDGSWRAKNEGDCRELGRWHLPDGSLCTPMDVDVERRLDVPKQIKQEDFSEGPTGLRLGIKKNHSGVWEFSKPEDVRASSSGNHEQGKFGNHFENLLHMSSSATGSYKDGEDPSVNQDGGANFDFPLNNINELDSISLNFDQTYDIEDRIPPVPTKDADVIVLSDSDDDDNVTMVSPKTGYNAPLTEGTGIPFPSNHHGFGETYSEEPALNDDFGMPIWQLPTYSQAGPTFQLFDADASGSNALVDSQQNSLPLLDGYGLATNDSIGEASHAQDLFACPSSMEVNGSLVDNPLAYGSNDPSLQIFLPSQPTDPPHADLNDHSKMANGDGLDNWISLSLGGAGGGKVDPASTNGLKSKQQFTSQENDTEPVRPKESPAPVTAPAKSSTGNIQAQSFTFRELATATNHFTPDCLLGEGGFGRVYKGTLESGQIVAIKQLDRNSLQGNREFLVEVLMLSLLHHPNLVNLVGYCADGDQRLLVYEFMSNNSLQQHLLDMKPNQKPLDWYTRMRIAFGAAQGLEYLHDKANPPVIYRDMKSSNILLDALMTPKLSDFGLAKLGPGIDKQPLVSSRVMGTYGYWAPEYSRNGDLTLKSDVYSFGVVLLELMSGRRATDPSMPTNEQNLVSWAQPMFKDQKRYPELVDPILDGDYPLKGLNQAVAIAAMCLQEEATVRPLMADVVMTLSFLIEPSPTPLASPTPAADQSPPPPAQEHRPKSSSSSSSSSSDEHVVETLQLGLTSRRSQAGSKPASRTCSRRSSRRGSCSSSQQSSTHGSDDGSSSSKHSKWSSRRGSMASSSSKHHDDHHHLYDKHEQEPSKLDESDDGSSSSSKHSRGSSKFGSSKFLSLKLSGRSSSDGSDHSSGSRRESGHGSDGSGSRQSEESGREYESD